MKKLLLITLPLLIFGCAGNRELAGITKSTTNAVADTLLLKALDNEALYSILDTIKPISSVKSLAYPIARDSSHNATDHQIVKNLVYLDSIAIYQQVCRKLSNKNVQFVVIPFQQSYQGQRNLEIYAVNISRLKSKIREYASFFGQFGITAESDPAQVITIIESEKKYNRWRGYGYLFGYPAYAVDFFVNAGQQQDSTGEFVKRDFFQIPVFSSETGHFTYAMPKGQQPGTVDSLLYRKATQTLETYSRLRKKYSRKLGVKVNKIWKRNK